MMLKTGLTLSFLLICCLARGVSASQIVDAKVETKLVPNPVGFIIKPFSRIIQSRGTGKLTNAPITHR